MTDKGPVFCQHPGGIKKEAAKHINVAFRAMVTGNEYFTGIASG